MIERVARALAENRLARKAAAQHEGCACLGPAEYCQCERARDLADARAVLALFAPILAEKEREIAAAHDTYQQAAVDTVALLHDAEARALAAEAAVLAVAPYVDSIVCYASTVDEHDGNRVAKLVNEAAAAIRAQIAAPGAAMERDYEDEVDPAGRIAAALERAP